MAKIRPAAVAGTFYPGDAKTLTETVRAYLAGASLADATKPPKAIIAPHAGYVYSGAMAARAYTQFGPISSRIKRVILLGPCHRVAVRGLALSGADAFSTPLGNIPVDQEFASKAKTFPQVQVFDPTHAREHSLEVHLPFLQVLLGDFKLVPLVVGDATPDEVADVLESLWGGPETIIVISSDLTHFLDYETARRVDDQTRVAIENLNIDVIDDHQACGRIPVKGLMALARRKDLRVETLGVCNSGDTAGDRNRVVGYGSWAFYENDTGKGDFESQTRALLDDHGPTLIRVAGASVEHGLVGGGPLPVSLKEFPDILRSHGACFVTLKHGDRLRGCIGSAQAHRPLIVDVADNGYAAAFRDPRFPNLTRKELDGLTLSISVLSPPTPMTIASEADLLEQLRPGVDGLIIEDGNRRALFLPSVWDQLPSPRQFLGHLKNKAGLPGNHWSPNFRAQRFIAGEISARDIDGPPLWSNLA